MPLGTLWGLLSAAGFGLGDFCGGLSARRISPVLVTTLVGLAGLVALATIAFAIGAEVPGGTNLALAALAGIGGGLGLAALYSAMASGSMGLVAGLSSAGSVTIALLFGVVIGKGVSGVQLAGVVSAVLAGIVAGGLSRGQNMRRALVFAGLAAVGFGIFLVLIDRAATPDPWWVLVASRSAATGAIGLLAVVMAARGGIGRVAPEVLVPLIPLLLLGGVLDAIGNLFFILSRGVIQVGLAAALSGLYPLVTMAAARAILGERLPTGGLASVGLAVLGVILISIGQPA